MVHWTYGPRVWSVPVMFSAIQALHNALSSWMPQSPSLRLSLVKSSLSGYNFLTWRCARTHNSSYHFTAQEILCMSTWHMQSGCVYSLWLWGHLALVKPIIIQKRVPTSKLHVGHGAWPVLILKTCLGTVWKRPGLTAQGQTIPETAQTI